MLLLRLENTGGLWLTGLVLCQELIDIPLLDSGSPLASIVCRSYTGLELIGTVLFVLVQYIKQT